MKAKYPDREFADDEALFGQINDDYDGYDKELSGYKEREKALSDLFASNPQSAAFLTDWRKGEDPIIGMVRKFGDDFKAALEDPEKQEALAAANKEFAERIAQEKEYEGEYQKNLDETLTTLETMQQEEGLPDEDIDSAMDFLVGIVRDGIMGKFTRERGATARLKKNYAKQAKMTVQPTLPVKTVAAVAVHGRCLTSVQSGVMMVHRTFGSVEVKNARR